MKIVRKVNDIVVAYVENAQGRSLQLGAQNARPDVFGGLRDENVILDPVVVARHKGDIDRLVRVLLSFRDDMPDAATQINDELRAHARGEG